MKIIYFFLFCALPNIYKANLYHLDYTGKHTLIEKNNSRKDIIRSELFNIEIKTPKYFINEAANFTIDKKTEGIIFGKIDGFDEAYRILEFLSKVTNSEFGLSFFYDKMTNRGFSYISTEYNKTRNIGNTVVEAGNLKRNEQLYLVVSFHTHPRSSKSADRPSCGYVNYSGEPVGDCKYYTDMKNAFRHRIPNTFNVLDANSGRLFWFNEDTWNFYNEFANFRTISRSNIFELMYTLNFGED